MTSLARLPLAATALSAAGVGASAYLTYTHFTDSPLLACPEGSFVNCASVTTSAQATLFGLVPVAVAGLAFFVGMLALSLPGVWRRGDLRLRRLRAAGAVAGVLMVLYLVWVEFHQLHALCLWCTIVHLLAIGLFVVVGYAEAGRPVAPLTRQQARRAGAR
ncbi:MAG: hypothetical protein QOK14_874 [Frankiaceae bacterium]|nr:hypothetical protein [Frankiaceae bacterium]